MNISTTEKTVEVTYLCVISIVAIFGNISLWIIILTDKTLQRSSNYLMLCMSGADLMVGSLTVPITMSNVIRASSSLSDYACVVFGMIQMTLFIGSVLSLAMISVNRYVLIVKAAKFTTMYTSRNTSLVAFGKQYYTSPSHITL